jgi:hypothetical protein
MIQTNRTTALIMTFQKPIDMMHEKHSNVLPADDSETSVPLLYVWLFISMRCCFLTLFKKTCGLVRTFLFSCQVTRIESSISIIRFAANSMEHCPVLSRYATVLWVAVKHYTVLDSVRQSVPLFDPEILSLLMMFTLRSQC